MRIVQLNLAADPTLNGPDALLASYHTLTGWSDALASTGATVHVVQRFSSDATRTRDGVLYEFVADGPLGTPPPWAICPRVADAVLRATPDVIHMNGLMFPGMIRVLRREAGMRVPIVLQDHSGALPRRTPRPLTNVRAVRWRLALQQADACLFTARQLAERWHSFGLPKTMRTFEVLEASTSLRPIGRHDGQTRTGLHGRPSILWVGRLDRNKDPWTILSGLESALPELAHARVWMIAPAGGLREEVSRHIDASPTLRGRVTIIGPFPHDQMAAYYSSADLFISGSHHEGSGYALIEALACGVVPCVTDIPSFRAIAGGCGKLWPPGDAAGFASSLRQLGSGDLVRERGAVRRRFEEELSWPAIGRQAVEAYGQVIETGRAVR